MNRGNVAPEVFYLTDAPNSPGSLAMLLAMGRRVTELAACYKNDDTVYGKPFGQSRQSADLLLIEASRLSLGFDKLAY